MGSQIQFLSEKDAKTLKVAAAILDYVARELSTLDQPQGDLTAAVSRAQAMARHACPSGEVEDLNALRRARGARLND